MTLPHAVLRSAVFLILGALAASMVQKPAEASTQLTFAPSAVRFGEIVLGQSQTLTAIVTNTGTGSFTLSTIASNNASYKVKHASLPLTLAAGRSTTLTITCAPTAYGANPGTVSINGGAASLYLHSWGASTNSLVPAPSSVSFSNGSVGAVSKSYVTLTNSRSSSVTIASKLIKGAGFTSQGFSTPLVLSAGQSFTFTVEFSPEATGSYNGTIFGYNSANDTIVSIPLAGYATAGGQLSLSPGSVSFGSVNVGSNLTKTGTLSAIGASVTVGSASSSNSEFSISGISFPKTIAAGQSVSYSVTFAPQSSGSASSTLSFASSSNTVSESLSGTGVAQTYSVSLTWDASTSSVSGYNVYRGANSGGPYSKVNPSLAPTTTYTDGGVAASHTYYYVTTAVNSNGQESGYSNQVQVVIP